LTDKNKRKKEKKKEPKKKRKRRKKRYDRKGGLGGNLPFLVLSLHFHIVKKGGWGRSSYRPHSISFFIFKDLMGK
jgi:hypothetical protein